MRGLLILTLCALLPSSIYAAWPPFWPVPLRFSNGTSAVPVTATIKVNLTCAKVADLNEAFDRFQRLSFIHAEGIPFPPKAIALLTVCVKNGTVPLQLGVDESYVLNVSSTAITLTCPTVYGCYHGLQTLSQLIAFDFYTAQYSISNAPWSISDAPRFAHRGTLIDSSRHFLPLPTIFTIIDSLSYAKLNVMHWHLVDSNSFPFVSSVYANLSKYGAYSPTEQYSTHDVSAVVEYARKRGVRVMVEFDTPGHTGIMCSGLPSVCPTPLCTNVFYNWALDITRNVTYEVVGNLISELSVLFPDRMMHLGGDEVDTTCWSQRPYIVQWLKERNLTLTGGFLYYVDRIHKYAFSRGLNVVGWEEIWNYFGTKLDPRTIIHQWLSDSIQLTVDVTSHGYRLIWSGSAVWYLDHLGTTWQSMYNEEPCQGLTAQQCTFVIGGEGCQWGETVDTSDALQTIWPRMGAIAERLWSPATTVMSSGTQDRYIAFRCWLNSRGIAAAPALNSVARSAPSGPGSCFTQ